MFEKCFLFLPEFTHNFSQGATQPDLFKHFHMVLSEAEETITTIEIDKKTHEEVYKTTKRTIPFFCIREDGVILVSPLMRVN